MGRFASKRQRELLYLLYDGRCAICQEDLEQFEADHLTPYSQQGVTQLWNLQPLCLKCHSEKTLASAIGASSKRSRITMTA
jgi:5-methylcytosine-specific restriction endonuclease McrA